MEIFEKNILLLEKINKRLADKIKNITEIKNTYELNTNLAGEYNLSYNGKLIHSVTGAEEEAKKVFQNLQNDSANTIHVIYGMGLGYQFDYYCTHAQGAVVLYEPDIELLHVVMGIVDFSSQLSKTNIFIASDIEELKLAFNNFFKYKTETTASYIDYYKFNYRQEIAKFIAELQKIQGIYSFNHKFHARTAFDFLRSTQTWLCKKIEMDTLEDYTDVLKNKPAIVVSAGPSLAKNIEYLKEAKNHAVIFCVGAAYKTLYDNGITPDFVVILEKKDTSIHYEYPNNEDVNLIVEPFAHYKIFLRKFKRHIISTSYETASNHWYRDIQNQKIPDFQAKGTVSFQALSSAKLMGCNPIILLGQDLAFVDGKCYAKGSPYEDLECIKDEKTGEYKIWPRDYEKFKRAFFNSVIGKVSDEFLEGRVKYNIEKMTKGLTLVKGQNNNMLPTQSGYAMFIEYFKDFARDNKSKYKLINSSSGGADIEGFENIPLEIAMKPYISQSINVEDILNSVQKSPNTPLEKIIKNINKEIENLNKIIKILQEGQTLVESLNRELEHHRKSTQKSVLTLKKIIDLYMLLTDKYFVRNRMYSLIATKENSDIAWIIKEKPNILKYEEQCKILEYVNPYFYNIIPKCEQTISLLKSNLRRMNESCITKG